MKIAFFIIGSCASIFGTIGRFIGKEPFETLVVILFGGLFLGVAFILHKFERLGG